MITKDDRTRSEAIRRFLVLLALVAALTTGPHALGQDRPSVKQLQDRCVVKGFTAPWAISGDVSFESVTSSQQPYPMNHVPIRAVHIGARKMKREVPCQ